ncbi:hypothetical protein [Lentilactobacillus hilgardii]|uniref:Uncharacterized protein n=1 Tax=Lentilactobacillus hilgardii (strain ATCC 8290 / DSM 20176 / CCUG 30140 / JCM 1155 / KCTC 3500 / NBRC 15886 / NCIMB 8040 / NRRL B-1843 / 9) TaxID=1423757 RepID=C0XGY8_LENH9|nr:hypothetical protein [Lentilactobacillus hilgardii]EEI25366.1 hypothetical protein HMPREF0519_0499 [Lentilactobacillus hilgardii DSM 20176 = ATCC 8290]KRK55534.1 hypothetical protein FD42_GL000954 [Lentilactobacillus hilgardii DSM 20176 = ATCC 8290]QEU39334.1 hypothetical protein LH500_10870 [Lentilactobacillus hilgardii]TDG79410.1 hypothetical protein C5L34_002380 [Lentilactobacillus hilgardii]
MTRTKATLITVEEARALLKDRSDQINERFPRLKKQGKYILPDYRLTRKREAFKIRKHTFLQRHPRSYVAFDSENGQTLWMHNFPSLTEAIFWLDTGLKPTDTDTSTSYKQWKTQHEDDINVLKEILRKRSQERKAAAAKRKEAKKVKK